MLSHLKHYRHVYHSNMCLRILDLDRFHGVIGVVHTGQVASRWQRSANATSADGWCSHCNGATEYHDQSSATTSSPAVPGTTTNHNVWSIGRGQENGWCTIVTSQTNHPATTPTNPDPTKATTARSIQPLQCACLSASNVQEHEEQEKQGSFCLVQNIHMQQV